MRLQTLFTIKKQTKTQQEEIKRNKIFEVFKLTHPNELLDPASLKITQAVYILALMRASTNESLIEIGPHDSQIINLAPTWDLKRKILISLYADGLIKVSPYSSMKSFNFDDDGNLKSYQIYEVVYATQFAPTEEESKDFISNLERVFRNKDWPETWIDDDHGIDGLYELWKEIALNECLQYLGYCCKERDLPYKPGPKTLQTLESTLENFSTSQTISMIYKASKDAIDFYHRKGTSLQHAANIIPGSIKRYADRALTEKWDVKGFERNYDLARTALAEVLFDLGLQIGEKGFTQHPELIF